MIPKSQLKDTRKDLREGVCKKCTKTCWVELRTQIYLLERRKKKKPKIDVGVKHHNLRRNERYNLSLECFA